MRLMINHQTVYQYQEPVSSAIQYIRMIPHTTSRQVVEQWWVNVSGHHLQQYDGFGNNWLTTTQNTPYQQLSILAQGIVDVDMNAQFSLDTHLTRPIHPAVFLQNTVRTTCTAQMKDFAQQQAGRDYERLITLAQALLGYMPYLPGETQVHTSAAQAFEQQRGVCQDHAQVFVAMARYLGYPARYVSGYLYVENSNHLASHAWAEVYMHHRWHCFDVSNQQFTPQNHVQIACGRDYADVAPVRGIRKGGGIETMHALVQVLAC